MDTEIREKSQQNLIVEARYPVRMLTPGRAQRGETYAISTYGALIRCQQPLRLNEVATISIELSGDEYLQAEAEAVWLEFIGQEGHKKILPRGMVVRFINLSTFDKQILREVINKNYTRKLNRLIEKTNGAF